MHSKSKTLNYRLIQFNHKLSQCLNKLQIFITSKLMQKMQSTFEISICNKSQTTVYFKENESIHQRNRILYYAAQPFVFSHEYGQLKKT